MLFSRALSVAALLALTVMTPLAHAVPEIEVSMTLASDKLAAGQETQLKLDIEVPSGWHLWSLNPGEGPLALTLRFENDGPVEFVGDWHGDLPKKVFDRGFERDLTQYEDGEVFLNRRIRLKPGQNPGDLKASLKLRGQICTDEQCLEQRKTLEVKLTALSEPGADAPAVTLEGAALSLPGAPPVFEGEGGTGGGLDAAKAAGLWAFLLAAFGAGFLALATPCVFPAIPLTVSFFSKYAEASFGRALRLAATYALTMIGAYTFGGVLISVFFGATGLNRFSAHPIFNLFLTVILVFFALNLLGMFELAPPAWLTSGMNKLQSRFSPIAQAKKDAKGGFGDYLVVAVAALTATTVFFTCTVAFVGGVVVAAASGEWFWPTLGMLAFSTAFALPFFFLALFPSTARKLQGKGGSWMAATRVALGFIELAAAFKFLSNADLVWKWELISRDLVLSIWVVLFALCGLFLLGKLRLGDDPPDAEQVGVGRMLISASVFALSLYLAVGLFQGRSFGGWIDGLLPPVAHAQTVSGSGGGGAPALTWIEDLEAGRRQAETDRRLVFVNYTGYTCTNCRYMEGGVFLHPSVRPLLDSMVRVELYTDGGEPVHEANRENQLARFQTAALPFYAIETPSGEVIATFPSSTNDPEVFATFLREGQARGEAKLQAMAPPSGAGAGVAAEAETGAAAAGAGDSAPKAACEPIGSVPGGAFGLKAQDLMTGCDALPLKSKGWSLINFWATWCTPCRIELKEFLVAHGKTLHQAGGNFVTLALEEEEQIPEAQAFMKELGVGGDMAFVLPADLPDDALPKALGYKDEGLPYTVLLSPEGKAVWSKQGALDESELRDALKTHAGLSL